MPFDLQQAVQAVWPAVTSPFTPAGAGDYARAYRSGDWLILHALHPFASICLKRVAQVTPHLAPDSPVPLPHVQANGESGGQRFIVYRAIPGEPLTGSALQALDATRQEAMAASLAALLRHLHQFPVALARATGVPECLFPLAFEEDRLREGHEDALYTEDLQRLETHATQGRVTPSFGRDLHRRLEVYLASRHAAPSVLLHGELSADHLLAMNEPGGLSGVIDFNGLHLGRPARDLMYVFDSYGETFVRLVLSHLPALDVEATLLEVRFLHGWHLLARLLWALDHDYAPGRERWEAALTRWLATPDH